MANIKLKEGVCLLCYGIVVLNVQGLDVEWQQGAKNTQCIVLSQSRFLQKKREKTKYPLRLLSKINKKDWFNYEICLYLFGIVNVGSMWRW